MDCEHGQCFRSNGDDLQHCKGMMSSALAGGMHRKA
jgi:hypothetical protein